MARASLVLRRKWTDEDANLYEMVIWTVARSAIYPEGVRYRLAFIRYGEESPAVLYDNHHPKGHHRHSGGRQESYLFVSARKLVDDFLNDVAKILGV